MYAVRYGNLELIDFFTEKEMRTSVNSIFNHVSMIHAAVYSMDVKILGSVLNNMKCSPNPLNSEVSPLKIAMKIGHAKMVELLICRGSYYAFGDVYNNIEPKGPQGGEESSKYSSILTGKDIINSAVVEDTTIKDCPIKDTLRWARVRQLMFLKTCAQKQKEESVQAELKFDSMSKIVGNERHFNLILKMCIGQGDSITKSSEVNEDVKEGKEL